MRPVHHANAASLALALGLIVGCAAPPRTSTDAATSPPAPQMTWDDHFGAVHEPRPIDPSIYPVRERVDHYRRHHDAPAAGAPRTEQVTIRWSRAEDDGQFPWRRHTPDGRVEHVRRNGDGSIVIGATEEPKHDALTQYEPPLVLWPAQLPPGEPITSEHRMTIVSLRNPQLKRDAGRCTRTFEHEKDQSVRGKDGSIRCHRVHSTIRAKLGLASVLTRETFWIAPHHGLIADDSTEAVTALLPLWVERRKIIRQPIPTSAAPDKP